VKKAAAKKTEDVRMENTDEVAKGTSAKMGDPEIDQNGSEEEDGERPRDYDEDDDDDDNDPFGGSRGYLGGGPGSMHSHLRAMSGMMSGSHTAQKLRELLDKLRQKDNPAAQFAALEDLSHLLLISTEDNLSGHFSPDQFVKELVVLMQPNDFGIDHPETMLMACRCIANLMEALPPATANVVYGGAVPVLCQKLADMAGDAALAEQALSVSPHKASLPAATNFYGRP
jgi:E3 ubiquitin-protein ligase TRIP12